MSVDSEDASPMAAESPGKSESPRRLVNYFMPHPLETNAVANPHRPTTEHLTTLHNHKHPKVGRYALNFKRNSYVDFYSFFFKDATCPILKEYPFLQRTYDLRLSMVTNGKHTDEKHA
ncbi:hypothetical protein Y032_0382g374 [Ancylostoma ceylanicum]|uniref:Uncharacterized protein n=1 Tax=Ancylostoma ceylanicum TaxID=53326 RepID=A0A016RT42_9BILA|nr:hypothetical protein Y032_0382g374 [Ancylostoma ceylanicum]